MMRGFALRLTALITSCMLITGCTSVTPTTQTTPPVVTTPPTGSTPPATSPTTPPAGTTPVGLEPSSSGHFFQGTLTASTAAGTGDLDCRDFVSQAEAQTYFNAHGGSSTNNVDALDWNHNGVPCEVNETWAARSNRWSTPTPPAPTVTPTPGPTMCWVNGYYRKDGTHVNGYWRRC